MDKITNEQRAHDFAMMAVKSFLDNSNPEDYQRYMDEISDSKIDAKDKKWSLYTLYVRVFNSSLKRFNLMNPKGKFNN